MDYETQQVATLMGEPSRGRILACLMDGRARTAKELAFSAGVTAQTASSHLAKLVAGSVLAVEAQGRHRYFRIARVEIAAAIEALMSAAGRASGDGADGAPAEEKLPPIKMARMCYDHLAGRLGVELLASMLSRRWLKSVDKEFEVTRGGEKKFAALGIDVVAAGRERRRFACQCLDWSERLPHLGGALGKGLAGKFLAEKWVRRREDSRALSVTEKGRRELASRFGVRWDQPIDARG